MKQITILAATLTLAFAVALAGCDESKNPPVKYDTGVKKDTGVNKDQQADQQTPPDVGAPDKPQWPDIWPDGPKNKDMKKDVYKGSPFGCSSDLDCLGQKCCPTPWGVKLCAPTCDLNP